MSITRAEFTNDLVMSSGVWLDARAYGSALNNTTLAAANTAAGTSRILVITPGTWTISGNLAFTANVKIMRGAVLSIASGITVTFGTELEAGAYKIFTYADATSIVSFTAKQLVNVEWWGVSTGETDANNTTYSNYAIREAWNTGGLAVNGYYDIDGALDIISTSTDDVLTIHGSRSVGWNQNGNGGEATMEVDNTAAQSYWTNLYIVGGLRLDGNSSSGDGLILRRCQGSITNLSLNSGSGSAVSNLNVGINMIGCIGMHLSNVSVGRWATGIRLGCYNSGGTKNSTNACIVSGASIRYSTTAAIYLEGDGANSLIIKGNSVKMLDCDSNSVASSVGILIDDYVQGNNFDSCWIEAVTTGVKLTGSGSYIPFQNMIFYPRVTTVTTCIDIEFGEDNVFMGGQYGFAGGAGTDVIIDSGCATNKFLFIRNFPQPVSVDASNGFSDGGNGTLVLRHGDGGNDFDRNLHYSMTPGYGMYLPNNTEFGFMNAAGDAVGGILKVDTSDNVLLRNIDETQIIYLPPDSDGAYWVNSLPQAPLTESKTITSGGVALTVTTPTSLVTTNGDSDLDNATLADGVRVGQLKHVVCVAEGNSADTWKITPATLRGGTQITFSGANQGCTLLWSGASGWVVLHNNGGTVS